MPVARDVQRMDTAQERSSPTLEGTESIFCHDSRGAACPRAGSLIDRSTAGQRIESMRSTVIMMDNMLVGMEL